MDVWEYPGDKNLSRLFWFVEFHIIPLTVKASGDLYLQRSIDNSKKGMDFI